MFVQVLEARYLGEYRVWLRFEDGLEGELDLGPELYGMIFEPLKDPAYFASFTVETTLTWSNGADFAPEFLHELLSAAQPDRKEPSVHSVQVPMFVHVIAAQHRGGHRVWLRFNDGLEGEIDLSTALRGPVFQPLKDPEYFAKFTVDDTLTWPNGADYAPEFLHDRVLEVQQIRAPRDP